jgi:hypothetical protein
MHNLRPILYNFSHEIPSSRIRPSISKTCSSILVLRVAIVVHPSDFPECLNSYRISASQCCFSCVYFPRRAVFSDSALLISE